MIKFLVNTRPKPQQRHRSRGGRFQYDPSAKDKKDFLLQCKQYAPPRPTDKEIEMELTFCYKRPRSHYRSKNKELILKEDAKFYKSSKADIDNLVKFVCDSLNGTFYKDDAQIVSLSAYKVWGSEDYVYVNMSHTKKYVKLKE